MKTIFEKIEKKQDYLWTKGEHLFLIEMAWKLYVQHRKLPQKEFALKVMKSFKDFEKEWKEKGSETTEARCVEQMRNVVNDMEKLLKEKIIQKQCLKDPQPPQTIDVSSSQPKPCGETPVAPEGSSSLVSDQQEELKSTTPPKTEENDLFYHPPFLTEREEKMSDYFEKVLKKIPKELWDSIGWHLAVDANKKNKPPFLDGQLERRWKIATNNQILPKKEVLTVDQEEEEAFLIAFGKN